MENVSNLYFDPDPTLYFLILKVLGGITVPICGLGLYCVIKKTPPGKSKVYRFIMLHIIFIASIFELFLTIFSPPLVYLPYIALEFRGIFTWIGIPPEIQLEMLITVVAAAFAAIVPGVYYHMDAVLGPQHIFNHILVKLSVYATVFGAAYILPTPFIALCIQDQLQVKISLESALGVHYDGFWRSETLAFHLGMDNLFTMIVALVTVGSLIGGNLVLVVCGYLIYHLIAKKAVEKVLGSTLRHQAFLGSVVTMMLLLMLIVGFICPTIALLLITHSQRADLINIAIMLGASVVPLTVSTYLFIYPPYAVFIMTPIRKLILYIRRRRRRTVASIDTLKMKYVPAVR